MTGLPLLGLITVFFLTSLVSVVTGSTSIITVPAMFQFGIDPRISVATNMFALTFMSVGGSLPFLPPGAEVKRRMPLLISLTLAGSAAGAFLLLAMPPRVVPLFVSVAVISVAVFALFYRRSGIEAAAMPPGRGSEITGYILTLLLGVYGGLFSGGYVTILTAVFVAAFRMTFMEAVAATKFVNIFSSGIATGIFMWRGVVNYRLGIVLGLTMFLGAWVGARFARRLGNHWIRRVYLGAVWLLGLKTLLFDLPKSNSHAH
jgi:hypothetical protein